ncbi:Cysteine-rich receptor-like protein kinase 10 [Hordeum vulgare]|nr:Cysteine-rich receptor-like protein kinase 10 [Hordeum vulgare]
MVATDEAALQWAREDYIEEEMERQCCALEEIAARRRGRDEGIIVILDESGEEAPALSNPIRLGDLGQGCSKDGGGVGDNDDDGDDDYTNFYKLLGI